MGAELKPLVALATCKSPLLGDSGPHALTERKGLGLLDP